MTETADQAPVACVVSMPQWAWDMLADHLADLPPLLHGCLSAALDPPDYKPAHCPHVATSDEGTSYCRLAGPTESETPMPDQDQPQPDTTPSIFDTLMATAEGRHPSTVHICRFFAYAHLPPALASVSKPSCRTALDMLQLLGDGPELTTGLRKLLEAKDCFVRAEVAADD